MKIAKTNKTKYPYKVTFNNGRASWVPSQHRFKTEYIRDHGCSLVAFYIALRYLGKKKTMGTLLRYTRKNLDKYISAKLTIKGVSVGINKIMKEDCAVYYPKPDYKLILQCLKNDRLILLETGNPIHTNVLIRGSGDKYYNISDGQVKEIDVGHIVSKATTSNVYRGCVIVR